MQEKSNVTEFEQLFCSTIAYKERLRICKECSFNRATSITQVCELSGTAILVKAKLIETHCPLNNW